MLLLARWCGEDRVVNLRRERGDLLLAEMLAVRGFFNSTSPGLRNTDHQPQPQLEKAGLDCYHPISRDH